jgi:hypothetical protein
LTILEDVLQIFVLLVIITIAHEAQNIDAMTAAKEARDALSHV